MRLDKYLAEHGFSSRAKAVHALERGLVTVNGRAAKASAEIKDGDIVEVKEEPVSFVSEGGFKLYKALVEFSEDITGKVFADLGASTGGFTDCLLRFGAARVYAADVGESQLDESLRADARVVVMDRVNARYLDSVSFPEKIDGVTADLSFISLKLILPAIEKILAEGGCAFVLVKPQFECEGKGQSKRGIVTDARIRSRVLQGICEFAAGLGLQPANVTTAPRRERKNIEYVLLLKKEKTAFVPISDLLKRASQCERE